MRVAVLVSGSGSNLQALIDAGDSLAPAVISLVISNRPGVRALDRARCASLPWALINHQEYESRTAFEQTLLKALREHDIEAVVLAGFMRVLSPHFVRHFEKRILNTHPALCPAFPGMHAASQAIDAGVKVSGCTVHLVDEGVDTGPIVFQEAVAVLDTDTPSTLQERIQALEHRLLPLALQRLASGALRVEGGRVRVAKESPWPH